MKYQKASETTIAVSCCIPEFKYNIFGATLPQIMNHRSRPLQKHREQLTEHSGESLNNRKPTDLLFQKV